MCDDGLYTTLLLGEKKLTYYTSPVRGVGMGGRFVPGAPPNCRGRPPWDLVGRPVLRKSHTRLSSPHVEYGAKNIPGVKKKVWVYFKFSISFSAVVLDFAPLVLPLTTRVR